MKGEMAKVMLFLFIPFSSEDFDGRDFLMTLIQRENGTLESLQCCGFKDLLGNLA